MSLAYSSPSPRGQSPLWMREIAVTELVAELVPSRPWTLPGEPARMVRSALGKALFELICAREHRVCQGCDLQPSCEIPTWYDPGKGGSHQSPPLLPESITPGGARLHPDEPLRVRLWLLGPAPRPGLIVEALVRMARGGLGPAPGVPHRLGGLTVCGEAGRARLVEDERVVGLWPRPGRLADFAPLPAEPRGATVLITAPLRWRDANPHQPPTLGDLLWASINRVRQVAREQGLPQPPRWEDPRALRQPWQQPQWHPARHQSSRQGTQDLSGWTGVARLGPEVAPWVEPLAACGVLGLGSAISTGRGRLMIDWR